jgi:hypothetical protein
MKTTRDFMFYLTQRKRTVAKCTVKYNKTHQPHVFPHATHDQITSWNSNESMEQNVTCRWTRPISHIFLIGSTSKKNNTGDDTNTDSKSKGRNRYS